MATTSGLTDLEAEANPTLNELLEKGSVEFPINDYIVHLNRGKATVPSTNCYSLSVNGIELNTPIIHYLNTGYFMFSIPDNLRRGTPGVIWDRNLYNALNRVIADPWFDPWFEEVITTAELLAKGNVEYSIGANIVHVETILDGKEKIIEGANVTMLSVSVNGVDLEHRLFYFSSGKPAKFMFQVPKSLDGRGEILVHDNNPYNALFRVVGKPEFSGYLEAVKDERAQKAAYAEQVTRQIIEEVQRFRAVLVRKYRQLTYTNEYEIFVNDRFLEEAKSFVKHRLPEIDSQWAARAVVIIDASVSGWAAEEDAARSDDAKFDASMSPTDYERFCADRFAAAGWKVRLTKGSGDQGADIVCEATGRRLVVQCKLYSASVGNSAVQEVIAAREFEYANSAAVVSNAPYTNAARELASTARVHLLHHDEISQLDVNMALN